LEIEVERSNGLLKRMLPPEIVERLKEGQNLIADQYKQAPTLAKAMLINRHTR
jgi:hypothetical protein